MPIILAHGALGPFDEIIFLGVVALFLTMMGISWVRSRNVQPMLDDDQPDTPAAQDADTPDRFRLD
jgi:hypothetical protein